MDKLLLYPHNIIVGSMLMFLLTCFRISGLHFRPHTQSGNNLHLASSQRDSGPHINLEEQLHGVN